MHNVVDTTKKLKYVRRMNKLIKNPLGEEIPEFMVANRNHTAKGAWQKNHQLAPLGKSFDNATAIGRATDTDIRTGWAGHLTPREIQDRWSRHGSVIPANHMDNHRDDIDAENFADHRRRVQVFNLQWSRCWQLRALTGWTPLAALDLDMHEHEYHFDDVDNFGAPHWWTLSQLV